MITFISSHWMLFVVVVVILGVIIFLILRQRNKNQKINEVSEEPQDGTNSQSTYEATQVRILDNTNRRVYNMELKGMEIKKIMDKENTLGRHLNREGKYIYGLIKLLNGEYMPMSVPSESKRQPEKLHNDMQHPYLEITADMKQKQGFLEKYRVYLWWGLIFAIIIFLMITSKKGH